MSADKSSLSAKVVYDESSQTTNTTIDNQDIKKDDLLVADKSSSAKEKVDQEPHQTTTSDIAKTNDNASTPKFEAMTNDSAKASTSSNENNSSPPVVHTTIPPVTSTNQASNISTNDSDASKHATEISNHESQNSPTTQIPDSDSVNKQANMTDTQDSQKSFTTMVPTSNQDANSVEQTNPPTDDRDNKKATNESTRTASNKLDTNKDDHGDPLPTTETSTSQIPNSNTNNQSNANTTHSSPKSSTTAVATSNQDSNIVDQTNQPTADSDTKQATDQGTDTTNNDQQTNKNENLMPSDESSTSQIPSTDANKQSDAVATDESHKTSTTDVPTSNQDPNSVDPTNPPTTDVGTKQDTYESNEDRKHLETLIDQEIKIIERSYPKLGKHGKMIEEDTQKAYKRFEMLKKVKCELKELKDLKKTVTKLRLQIPARYMSYDESDKQKNQQPDIENRDNIPMKNMPRLHDKHFHESHICNAIHLRFNKLRPELKLCLLCFSVFPEKAVISRRSMIYWWIGEGFIPITQEYDNEESCANRFFEELMENDFIQPVSRSYGRYVPTCKMNPMVRAALVMIAEMVNFFDFDNYGNPKDLGKFDEIESPEDMPDVHPLGEPREFFYFWDAKRELISEPIEFVDSDRNQCQFAALPKDPSIQPIKRDGKPIEQDKKHYYYRKRKITTKSHKVCLVGSGLSKGIPWENLHTLFNVQAKNLEFRQEWFLRMKNLNIMFLGRWQSSVVHRIEAEEFEFEKIFDNMKYVRFFSLQGVSRISKLPDSISNLKSLIILDLRSCHNLEVLPKTIGSLKCLTHLDMSECYLLNKIPKEISFLESLQVLKGFVVVATPGRDICTLEDLTRLVNLRKLQMYTHMKDFPRESHLDALEMFESLTKLTIFWRSHDQSPSQTKNYGNYKKNSLASKVRRLLPWKKTVQGSMRRMDAFDSSTLFSQLQKLDLRGFPHDLPRKEKVQGSIRRMDAFGSSTWGSSTCSRLQKLDLRGFPHGQRQDWLKAEKLKGLKKLFIRGGMFSQFEWNDSTVDQLQETWNVEILRLKYLEELNMEWKELQTLFPKLLYLEKVKCPRLTLFPCNEQGVWMKHGRMESG